MVRILTGWVVRTPDASQPYKVRLQSDGDTVKELPASSVREAEALIRAQCGSGPAIPLDPLRAYHAPDPWVMDHCTRGSVS